MLRAALPAFLVAGRLLLPTPAFATNQVCVTVTVALTGHQPVSQPVCVPYDDVVMCGDTTETLPEGQGEVVVGRCVPVV